MRAAVTAARADAHHTAPIGLTALARFLAFESRPSKIDHLTRASIECGHRGEKQFALSIGS
jgi:hypothetical protein